MNLLVDFLTRAVVKSTIWLIQITVLIFQQGNNSDQPGNMFKPFIKIGTFHSLKSCTRPNDTDERIQNMDNKLGVVDYKLSEVLQEFADMRSERLPKTEGTRRKRKTVYRL